MSIGAYRARVLSATACTFVVAFVLSIAAFRDPSLAVTGSLAERAGGIAGTCVVPCMICWTVFYFIFGLRNKPAWDPVAWPFFFLAYIPVVGLIALLNQAAVTNGRAAVEDMRQIADMKPGQASSAPIHSTGDVGTLVTLIRDFTKTEQADAVAYRSELDTLRLGKVLSAESVANPQELKRSVAATASALSVVQKYRAMNMRRLDDLQTQLDGLNVSPAIRDQAILGYRKGLPGIRAKLSRLWNDELTVVQDLHKATLLLSQRRADWAPQNRKLIFSNPSTMKAFNGYVVDVRSRASDEASIRQTIKREQYSRLQTMQNAVNGPSTP